MAPEERPAVYGLGYSLDEKDRLIQQNDYLIGAVGFTIHPKVIRSLPTEGLQIAELATGTGVFLRSLAPELPPDTVLHGYDIADDSFLAEDELPSNVKLGILDAKKPVPVHLHNKYHIVFIRYLNIALRPDDWATVAANAKQMLRPGGTIQWLEANFPQQRHAFASNATCTTDAIEHLVGTGFDTCDDLSWGPTNLTKVLSSVGFTDAKEHRISSDRRIEDRVAFTLLNVMALHRVVMNCIAVGIHPHGLPLPEAGEWNMAFERAKREISLGGYTRCDIGVWTAQKLMN